jgi:hypothetical protein
MGRTSGEHYHIGMGADMREALASIRAEFAGFGCDLSDLSDEDLERELADFREAVRTAGITAEAAARAFTAVGETIAQLQRGLPPWRDDLRGDYFDTLFDLARAGDESTFKDLARSVGVPAEDVDALWSGTVAQIRS